VQTISLQQPNGTRIQVATRDTTWTFVKLVKDCWLVHRCTAGPTELFTHRPDVCKFYYTTELHVGRGARLISESQGCVTMGRIEAIYIFGEGEDFSG